MDRTRLVDGVAGAWACPVIAPMGGFWACDLAGFVMVGPRAIRQERESHARFMAFSLSPPHRILKVCLNFATPQPLRGKHQLQRDENGLEKCVACFLCAAACPSNCIYIEAAENTEEKRISSAERYAKVYNIDYNRCIFCGYCVEACPTDAITHGHGFELASLNATNLVMRKEDLLVPSHKLPDAVQSAQDEAEMLA